MANLTVANTILEQLGGNKFLAMTGANTLVGSENSLSMRLPARTRNKANALTITLTPMDDYTLEFTSIRGGKFTPKGTVSGVYNDNLRDVFTAQTGLYTTLGTMRLNFQGATAVQ